MIIRILNVSQDSDTKIIYYTNPDISAGFRHFFYAGILGYIQYMYSYSPTMMNSLSKFTWSCLLAPVGKHTKTSFPSKSFFTACICIIYMWRYPSLAAAEDMSDLWLTIFSLNHCNLIGSACFWQETNNNNTYSESPYFLSPSCCPFPQSARLYGILWVCKKYSFLLCMYM